MSEHADNIDADDEQRVELVVPEVTAPTFPWELVLRNSATFYQATIGGGMTIKFCPLASTPQGLAPLPPGVVIEFNADAWARFMQEIAAGGVKPTRIETARVIPGGILHTNGDK